MDDTNALCRYRWLGFAVAHQRDLRPRAALRHSLRRPRARPAAPVHHPGRARDHCSAHADKRTARQALISMGLLHALKVRILQTLALFLPGGSSLRVRLHRWRGVRIGRGVFVSTDVLIETMRPELVTIGDDVFLGVRTTIMAHFNDVTPLLLSRSGHSVTIGDQVFIGPGAIILPGVTIARGAVVAAG